MFAFLANTAGMKIGVSAAAPSYSNPGGTGDRTAMIAVQSNITPQSGTIDNLIDGSFANDAAGAVILETNELVRYIRFDLNGIDGQPKCINEFKWYQNLSSTHTHWTFEASNDGDWWDELVSDFTLGGVAGAQTVAVPNTEGYRYYRLREEPNGTISSSPRCQEIEFKIDTGPAATVDTSAASYGNPKGSFDRTSGFPQFVDANGITFTDGTPDELVDGDFVSSAVGSCKWTSGQTLREILFSFGQNVILTSAFFRQSIGSSHGTWKWQYSTGTSSGPWVDIGGTFTLGNGATTQDFAAQLGAHATLSSFYRLLQTAGSTSNSPWLREFNFKVRK